MNEIRVAALAALLLWRQDAIAGTTGSLTGTVVDAATKAPIAGANVTATSPSQVARVTTDSAGRFTFISLAPDTYTIQAEHAGFEILSIAGISVFADQSQTIPIALQRTPQDDRACRVALVAQPGSPGHRDRRLLGESGADERRSDARRRRRTEQRVLGDRGHARLIRAARTKSASIRPSTSAAATTTRSDTNTTACRSTGRSTTIRATRRRRSASRSCKSTPAAARPTPTPPASRGFINQVIKTGTFPGYAVGSLAVGTPTFYHDARVEAGGSTPDRMFSYYVGLSGTNQDFRYFDQFNGASLTDTIPYGYWPAHITTFLPFYPAVYPTCSNNFTYTNPAVKKYGITDPGCFGSYPSYFGQPSNISSRDVVANFHVGIPHRRDAGRDDVQLLYMSSANFQQDYSSLDDAGALGLGIVNDGLNPTPNQCSPPDFYCGHTNQWPDFYTYPGNTRWLAPASTTPIPYMYPGSPGARCANVYPLGWTNVPNTCPLDANGNQIQVQIPSDYRDGRWDTASIGKLQYQKNFGSSAYARLFGYIVLLEHQSRHGQRLRATTRRWA